MESVSRSSNTPPSVILSIIGGALMVAGGLMPLAMFGVWNQPSMMYGWGQSGMMGGGFGMMMPLQSFAWIMLATMSAVSLGIGIILIIGGYSIYKKPESASKWGVAILVASVIGIFGMGGFFIGPILGIIGGILALTKK